MLMLDKGQEVIFLVCSNSERKCLSTLYYTIHTLCQQRQQAVIVIIPLVPEGALSYGDVVTILVGFFQ